MSSSLAKGQDNMADNTVPIPQPPGLPLLGNINDINPEFPLGSMMNMADKYGVGLLMSTSRSWMNENSC